MTEAKNCPKCGKQMEYTLLNSEEEGAWIDVLACDDCDYWEKIIK